MTQLSFSDVEFGAKRKQTRRDKFLAEMDAVIPWARLVALVEPFYPKGKLCQCFGTDRLQFYIRPVVQVGACWP